MLAGATRPRLETSSGQVVPVSNPDLTAGAAIVHGINTVSAPLFAANAATAASLPTPQLFISTTESRVGLFHGTRCAPAPKTCSHQCPSQVLLPDMSALGMAPAPAPGPSTGCTYTVGEGEFLYSIAQVGSEWGKVELCRCRPPAFSPHSLPCPPSAARCRPPAHPLHAPAPVHLLARSSLSAECSVALSTTAAAACPQSLGLPNEEELLALNPEIADPDSVLAGEPLCCLKPVQLQLLSLSAGCPSRGVHACCLETASQQCVELLPSLR